VALPFELLRHGLTENYLVPEAAASGVPLSQELMPGSTFEDFMGPEFAGIGK